MNNKSFTLIELVVAIVIMVIIATMGTMTQMSSYNSLKLDAAAQKIASDIRLAQELAMDCSPAITGVTWSGRLDQRAVINFNAANETYRIVSSLQTATGCSFGTQVPSTDIEYAPIEDPFTHQLIMINISQEYPGVEILSVNLNSSNRVDIVFKDTAGAVGTGYWYCLDSPNVVFMANQELDANGGTITLRDTRGRTKIIRIAQSTGRVTIE